MDELKQQLEQGEVGISRIFMEVILKMKIRNGEDSYNSFSVQGLGIETDEYFYDRGTPPVHENEIAITHVIAEKIHADIGDTVYVTSDGEETPYIITAVYQSMDNLGEGIRFPEVAEIDYSAVTGAFGVQVELTDQTDREKLLTVIEKTKTILPEATVRTVTEFIDSMIGGISEQLRYLKVLILIIVIIINILVVMLMQRMFMIREQGEMGMLKALGFSNGSIISWQAKRIALVLLAGILLGTVTGTPFSQVTSGQVFKLMGASRITFVINPSEVYLIYPAALFAATMIACILTMLKVRKISAQEMNHIE